jgi:alpha-D-ribose 1-methylphosphonate 5-triphosphate synthase subunit PhnG
MSGTVDGTSDRRRRWLSVLAKAPVEEIEQVLAAIGGLPEMTLLRAPEVGLVMARGRAGGTGQRFNLGEVPVTRCSVKSDGRIGHGYVRGRDKRHALLIARLDALLQTEDRQASLMAEVIAPLAAAQAERRATAARKAAATRVEFFTMVRGEDG